MVLNCYLLLQLRPLYCYYGALCNGFTVAIAAISSIFFCNFLHCSIIASVTATAFKTMLNGKISSHYHWGLKEASFPVNMYLST